MFGGQSRHGRVGSGRPAQPVNQGLGEMKDNHMEVCGSSPQTSRNSRILTHLDRRKYGEIGVKLHTTEGNFPKTTPNRKGAVKCTQS